MKIAVISDVHGNFPALKAVVDDAQKNNCEKFIFLGDYVFDLPFSIDVTKLLMDMPNSHLIKGNKEVFLSKLAEENQKNWINRQMAAAYYTFNELYKEPELFSFLTNLDDIAEIELDYGNKIYASHTFNIHSHMKKSKATSATFHYETLKNPSYPNYYEKAFSEMVNTNEFKSCINHINANIILFGHTHLQSHAYCGEKLIINPGSCGQPLDFNINAPYTILEINKGSINVIEKRVEYDVLNAIEKTKQSVFYKEGQTWTDLVCIALKTGKDYFGIFFNIAEEIALSKNEGGRKSGEYFSNATWESAKEIFFEKYSERY